MQPKFHIASLVPGGLAVESVTCVEEVMIVTARAQAGFAKCPACGTGARPIHSRYLRQVYRIFPARVEASACICRRGASIARRHTVAVGSLPNVLTTPSLRRDHAEQLGLSISSTILASRSAEDLGKFWLNG